MNTKTTYRSWVFASFYFGGFLIVAGIWFFSPYMHAWGAVVLIGFGLLGLPWLRGKVEIDDEGITQRIFRSRSVKWVDIISWQRAGHPDSDGPDTITITTRAGSFTPSHNCVFGKRLDFVESELRRRIAQRDGPANGSQPFRSERDSTSSAAGSRR